MKYDIEIMIDDATKETYEQLKIGDDPMNDTCDVCRRKVEQATIMQYNYKTYLGHYYCMKALRMKLEGKK